MRFIRYQTGADAPRYGWVYDDRVGPIEGVPFGEFRRLEAEIQGQAPLDRSEGHPYLSEEPHKLRALGGIFDLKQPARRTA